MHPDIKVINNFHGYFGSAHTACIPLAAGTLSRSDYYPHLNFINVALISTLSQRHSTEGIVLEVQDTAHAYQGDFIITQLTNHAIGMWTADCLALFMYESSQNIIGVLHAGWRGIVGGIISRFIQQMIQKYHCTTQTMHFLLGPSAQGCCYTIDSELAHKIYKHYPITQSLSVRNDYFFDLKTLAIEQLLAHSISSSLMSIDWRCTICHDSFYSYRNTPTTKFRQINLCWLSYP